MAEPLLDRGLDWLSDWGDFVSDSAEALPFDISVDPRRETAVGHYDVGTTVRSYQLAWLGEKPNHATPLELHALLLELDGITAQVEQGVLEHSEGATTRAAKLGLFGATGGGLGVLFWVVGDKAQRDEQRTLDAVALDVRRWRTRLDRYIAEVEAAIPSREQDRKAVLWEVTAPLFLGWFGGPTGAEIDLVGQPQGFDATQQHLADIGTPYRLANELGVHVEWAKERRRLFKKDVRNNAEDTGRGVAKATATVAIALGLGAAAYQAIAGQLEKGNAE